MSKKASLSITRELQHMQLFSLLHRQLNYLYLQPYSECVELQPEVGGA